MFWDCWVCGFRALGVQGCRLKGSGVYGMSFIRSLAGTPGEGCSKCYWFSDVPCCPANGSVLGDR